MGVNPNNASDGGVTNKDLLKVLFSRDKDLCLRACRQLLTEAVSVMEEEYNNVDDSTLRSVQKIKRLRDHIWHRVFQYPRWISYRLRSWKTTGALSPQQIEKYKILMQDIKTHEKEIKSYADYLIEWSDDLRVKNTECEVEKLTKVCASNKPNGRAVSQYSQKNKPNLRAVSQYSQKNLSKKRNVKQIHEIDMATVHTNIMTRLNVKSQDNSNLYFMNKRPKSLPPVLNKGSAHRTHNLISQTASVPVKNKDSSLPVRQNMQVYKNINWNNKGEENSPEPTDERKVDDLALIPLPPIKATESNPKRENCEAERQRKNFALPSVGVKKSRIPRPVNTRNREQGFYLPTVLSQYDDPAAKLQTHQPKGSSWPKLHFPNLDDQTIACVQRTNEPPVEISEAVLHFPSLSSHHDLTITEFSSSSLHKTVSSEADLRLPNLKGSKSSPHASARPDGIGVQFPSLDGSQTTVQNNGISECELLSHECNKRMKKSKTLPCFSPFRDDNT